MTNFMYIFCLIVWGGLNFIAVKIQGTPVSLELSLTYRLVMTALLFFILAWFMKPQGKPQQRDVPFIIIFGVCNFAFSYLALYYATIWSSAAIVTLIFSLKVILTPIALRIFLREPLPRRVLIGGILGVIGVGVLIYPSLHNIELKGVLIAFVGTVLTAIGDASSARNAKQQINPPVYANAIGFTVGSAVMCVIVWLQGQTVEIPKSITYLSALLYLTLIASFLAWLFYLKLVERLVGQKVAIWLRYSPP